MGWRRYKYKKSDRDFDLQHKEFSKKVIARDKKCVLCGSKKRLQAHHIFRYADSPSLRYSLSNGCALCSKCHYKIRNKEHCYADQLWGIINGTDTI